jgi:predicted component of type VI protein secretion system
VDYSAIVKFIKKRIVDLKENLAYTVDSLEQLQYIRGQIRALETLLQDLKDLQQKQEQVNDDGDDGDFK